MLRSGEKVGDKELKDPMIGHEIGPVRQFLQLSHPLEEGIVKNWDQMELIW
jgi:actin-related protein 2